MWLSKTFLPLALLGVAAIGRCNAMDGEEGSRDARLPVTDDPRSVHYQPDPAPAPAAESNWRPSSPSPAPSREEAAQLYPFSANDRPWTLFHVQAHAASSSNMPASFHSPRVYWQIDRFTTGDGRSYGPYMIGSTRFLLQPYPLDMPVLAKFYDQPGWMPVDFERLGGHIGPMLDTWIFRPEPGILRLVRHQLHVMLDRAGLRPGLVGNQGLTEGEYLWPPLSMRAYGVALYMPTANGDRLSSAVARELAAHTFHMPRVFRLEVPLGSHSRYILMTPVASGHFTPVAAADVPTSEFWVFHEAMVAGGVRTPQYSMALLGGMFLPKRAATMLGDSAFFRRAVF